MARGDCSTFFHHVLFFLTIFHGISPDSYDLTCQSCLADPLALFRAPVAVPAPWQTQWAYLRYRRLKAETDRTSLLGYLDILGRCWDRLGFVYPVACCSLQLAIAQRSADKLRHMPGLPGRVPMEKSLRHFAALQRQVVVLVAMTRLAQFEESAANGSKQRIVHKFCPCIRGWVAMKHNKGRQLSRQETQELHFVQRCPKRTYVKHM